MDLPFGVFDLVGDLEAQGSGDEAVGGGVGWSKPFGDGSWLAGDACTFEDGNAFFHGQDLTVLRMRA